MPETRAPKERPTGFDMELSMLIRRSGSHEVPANSDQESVTMPETHSEPEQWFVVERATSGDGRRGRLAQSQGTILLAGSDSAEEQV